MHIQDERFSVLRSRQRRRHISNTHNKREDPRGFLNVLFVTTIVFVLLFLGLILAPCYPKIPYHTISSSYRPPILPVSLPIPLCLLFNLLRFLFLFLLLLFLGASAGPNHLRKTARTSAIPQRRGAGSAFAARPAAPDGHLVPDLPGDVVQDVVEDGDHPGREVDDGQDEL